MTDHHDIVHRNRLEADRRHAEMLDEIDRKRSQINNFVRQNCRLATAREYQDFLQLRTLDCTHFYDYDMPDQFYVAHRDCEVPPAHGASAIQVIAPKGVSVTHAPGGSHNNIFDMNNPDAAAGWVPSFNNAFKY